MKKILIMDDDPTIADLLTEALADEGYETYMTTQSLRFYDAFREHQPDLILLDLMMPYLDGRDELKLMSMGSDRQIPVIVVTADVSAVNHEKEFHEAGVAHIIYKPFDLDKLVELVKQTIGEPEERKSMSAFFGASRIFVNPTARVALDAMGGDNAPGEVVLGAIQAAREYGIGVYLVGHETPIRAELAKNDTTGLDLPIVHTDEVIDMDDRPATAVRRKKKASMLMALELVRDGKALGAVSAGNSGAMMAASLFILKRVPGVDRPALGGMFPTIDGACLVIDIGANTDCKPEYLQQFALMGSIYVERIFQVSSPRVGLLANGEEETKGNQQIIETHRLLKASAPALGINFVGNIEGRDIPTGTIDVAVCDGFVGNAVLKFGEGLGETLFGALREQMTSNIPVKKLAAAVLRPDLRKVVKRFDYSEYGGIPLLGVNGSAIVSHGRSNAKAIKNALRVARQTAETGVPAAIAQGLQKLDPMASQNT